MKNHSTSEIEAGLMLEKDISLTEMKAGLMQGSICKCMLY